MFGLKHLLNLVLATISLNAFANDTTVCKGNYTNDSLKDGVWVCRKGNLVVKKEHYKKGVLVSYIWFNEKGQMIETKNRKGKVKKYNPCGC